MVSSGDPWSGPCLDALNTWFGRPDIPIGVVKEPTVTHESKYAREIASTYPHVLQKTENAQDAVELYREILSSQPDGSVIIITVGYLTNLKNLLDSGPDSTSPLTGAELVETKVSKLVCMGGKYPEGREWNFYQDSEATIRVVTNWPSPIFFIGYESGLLVETGSVLKRIEEPNPISRSYELYDNLSNRPSWDQLAVLYASLDERHRNQIFNTSRPGLNEVSENGSNRWQPDHPAKHYVVSLRQDSKEVADTINQLMLGR